MILRLMSLGIPVAGFFAAGVIAGQAEPAKESARTAEAEAEPAGAAHRVVKVKVVKDADSGKGDTHKEVIVDGEEISGELEDVEKVVAEALEEAMRALEQAEARVRVELNGKQLAAASKEHREAVARARARLEGLEERIAEKMARVEVRVEKAARKAADAAEKAANTVREHRVIRLRDSEKNAQIEVIKGEDGETVVVIEGDNVKVITREVDAHKEHEEKAAKPKK